MPLHVVCLDGGGGAGPVLVNANIAHVIMGGAGWQRQRGGEHVMHLADSRAVGNKSALEEQAVERAVVSATWPGPLHARQSRLEQALLLPPQPTCS